jgi:hypothetical protein
MLENLRDYKIDFATIPYVLQLNKRDLPNVTPANELISVLRKKEEPVLEAVAYKGDGVVDTLKAISKLIMSEVKNKIG